MKRLKTMKKIIQIKPEVKQAIINSNKLTESWVPHLPSIYQIEVMSKCDFSCSFCQTGIKSGEKLRLAESSISEELFYKIVERDLGGSSFVELQWRGEPTLNKKLNEYVLALRDKVLVGFSTHGGLLHTDHAIQAALNSHYITISMDAGEKELYEQLRIGGIWEKLVANITELLQAKGNRLLPIVDLQLIEFENFECQVLNIERLGDLHGWWKKDGSVRIRTVKDTQAPWTQNYKSHNHHDLCTNPWYSVSIKVNGDVCACCMTFDDNKDLVYGNLNDASLEEIWNSHVVRQFRVAHRHGFMPRFCNECYARSPHNLHTKLTNEILQIKLRN